MLPGDFIFAVTEYQLSALIPTEDDSVGVQMKNGKVFNFFDQRFLRHFAEYFDDYFF